MRIKTEYKLSGNTKGRFVLQQQFLGRVNTGFRSDYDGLLKNVRHAGEGETFL